MDQTSAANIIAEGKAVLGIELGSTRIKAVLIDEKKQPLASGSHDWENRLEDGVWTYHLTDTFLWKIIKFLDLLGHKPRVCDYKFRILVLLFFQF